MKPELGEWPLVDGWQLIPLPFEMHEIEGFIMRGLGVISFECGTRGRLPGINGKRGKLLREARTTFMTGVHFVTVHGEYERYSWESDCVIRATDDAQEMLGDWPQQYLLKKLGGMTCVVEYKLVA